MSSGRLHGGPAPCAAPALRPGWHCRVIRMRKGTWRGSWAVSHSPSAHPIGQSWPGAQPDSLLGHKEEPPCRPPTPTPVTCCSRICPRGQRNFSSIHDVMLLVSPHLQLNASPVPAPQPGRTGFCVGPGTHRLRQRVCGGGTPVMVVVVTADTLSVGRSVVPAMLPAHSCLTGLRCHLPPRWESRAQQRWVLCPRRHRHPGPRLPPTCSAEWQSQALRSRGDPRPQPICLEQAPLGPRRQHKCGAQRRPRSPQPGAGHWPALAPDASPCPLLHVTLNGVAGGPRDKTVPLQYRRLLLR